MPPSHKIRKVVDKF